MSFLRDPVIKKRMEKIKARCEHFMNDGLCGRDYAVCSELFNEGCDFDVQVLLSEDYTTLEQTFNALGIPTYEQELNEIVKGVFAHMELRNEEQLTLVMKSQANLFKSERTFTIKGYQSDLFKFDWIKQAMEEEEDE